MYKQAIEKFGDQKNWYRDIHDYIFSTYENPYLFAGLLASTSPRLSIKRNWDVTVSIYNRVIEGDRSIDYRNEYGLMPSHILNIFRTLDGEKIHGDKVWAFYCNLCGCYDHVTIDGWMLKFFGFEGWITPRRYEKMADRIRSYAKKVDMEPAELQAVCWSYTRDRAGFVPKSFIDFAEMEV
jgi:hypothetical protein